LPTFSLDTRETGFTVKGEECGLVSVLGVLQAEHTTADTPDHRAMPAHQGRAVPFFDETSEQLPIVQVGHILQNRAVKVPDHRPI
jgi:hypothetical protein